MLNSLDISIIIPAKDEEESILELSQWIGRVMQACVIGLDQTPVMAAAISPTLWRIISR